MMTKEEEFRKKIQDSNEFKENLSKLVEEGFVTIGCDAMIMQLELMKLKLANFHLTQMYKLDEIRKDYEKKVQEQG